MSRTLGPISLDWHRTVIDIRLYSITSCYNASMCLGSLERLRGLTHIPKLLQQMDTLSKAPNTAGEHPYLDGG